MDTTNISTTFLINRLITIVMTRGHEKDATEFIVLIDLLERLSTVEGLTDALNRIDSAILASRRLYK